MHINVLNQPEFDAKSEVKESDFFNPLKPARPFKEMLDMIDKEPRLQLALDTYVQMIIGAGLQVKAEKKKDEKKIKEWFNNIFIEDKIEDGLNSFVGVGNWIIETDPTGKMLVEVPIDSVMQVRRLRDRTIKHYVTEVNNRTKLLNPENIVHFKFSNTRQEVWGRGIFHSILNKFIDPETGEVYDAPIFAIKKIEDNIVKITDHNAAPIRMVYFEDAGDNFLKAQGEKLKKAKKGATVLTDKKFDIKNFESSGDSKFQGWIDHIQQNVIETGAQFPLQFFTAGFTARASSESTDTMFVRKINRIRKRFLNQFKHLYVQPYLDLTKSGIKEDGYELMFGADDKVQLTIDNMITLFRDNGIRRSELRKNILKKTTMEIDPDDMDDEVPITSVTDTGQLRDNKDGRFGGDDKNKNGVDDKKEDTSKDKEKDSKDNG